MPSGRCPRWAIPARRLRLVVVLPTPPFWLKTAMTAMRRVYRLRARGTAYGRRRCRSAIIYASMNRALQIAILAAGEGKRMRSALPKVLHLLGGKPLLAHVLETARRLEPGSTCVVYGDDEVRQRFAERRLEWARQDLPRGTGDALRCALA